jgi:hypothetical protein
VSKDTGGPAFPGLHPSQECRYQEEGMTLRDYFAIHATDADVISQGELLRVDSEYHLLPDGWRTVARYMHADAMLKEREK